MSNIFGLMKSSVSLFFTPCGKLVKFFGGLKSNHYIWALVYTQMKRKKQFWKHSTLSLLRYWPWWPQRSPMGPKFLVQIFSHTTLRWSVIVTFLDLLAKIWSLFSDSGSFPCLIAILEKCRDLSLNKLRRVCLRNYIIILGAKKLHNVVLKLHFHFSSLVWYFVKVHHIHCSTIYNV